ncbi:MAG: hypothetical protein LBL58_10635 [Tannerellaceae bacterium]|jgi:hypothetical protein|nr:hypothetical protein [Tannerellaceae bacterium]
MEIISIKNIVKSLDRTNKIYLTTYDNEGYELGFGKSGYYKGHSHYFFYDILFSPHKLLIKNKKNLSDSFLAVVPPRTFMNDVEIGDFFFIKFCPTNENFSLPEKTDIILNEGEIEIYSKPTLLNFTCFKTRYDKINISISAEADNLVIKFHDSKKIKIVE